MKKHKERPRMYEIGNGQHKPREIRDMERGKQSTLMRYDRIQDPEQSAVIRCKDTPWYP